ncbi:MAG: DegV family protein [Pseudomonadota bacterium]|jgi:DegV family protein with EDD domain
MRIGVVVDSACDLPKSFIEENNIVVMPIAVRVGDRVYDDRRDPRATWDFYACHLDTREENHAESIPYSAEQIESLFLDRLVVDYDHVFCLTITNSRSQIHANANRAALNIVNRYKERRRAAGINGPFGLAVINSRTMFTGQAVQAAEIVRLIREGATPSQIGSRVRELTDATYAFLMPADLFHVYKRASKRGDKSINWGTYTIGSLLDIKPILCAHRDQTGPVAKVRGFEAGVERLFRNAVARIREGLKAPFVCISYGGDPEKVKTMPGYEELEHAARQNGVEILHSVMSMTAAVNVGSGALSLGYAAAPHAFN